ncbi:unnamed protein product [Leptidea sinapis]|uniref:Arrestin C-terminal-like domain-containing protein n=1 Tax=Leptidea sinapis TaxID=189913 RepID=A0A5E4QMF8_9NEOP|nr:unnamed protein product [Leptidea sinapis]
MSLKGFTFGTVCFDEPRAIYYAGQTLSGTIKFDIELPVTFTAIKAHYSGHASVSWNEDQSEKYGGVERVRTINYVGNELYVNNEQYVLGTGAPTLLPAGPHTIKFSYQLPYNIPSSFNGEKGSIKYCMTAYLEYPEGHHDKLTADFDIVDPLDLNTIECLRKPIETEYDEVSSCNMFCQSQPIIIKIVVPVGGYCPGQTIPIGIQAQNDSSVEVTRIKFQLIQRVRYHSTHPRSTYVTPEEVLESASQGPIMSHTKRSLTCPLRVPDIIAYNTQACGIIEVAYFIKMLIKMSGCVDNCEDDHEIRLGLIPIQETLTDSYVHPLSHLLPTAPIPKANMNYSQNGEVQKNVNENDSGFRQYDIGFKVPGLPLLPLVTVGSNIPQPSAPPLP